MIDAAVLKAARHFGIDPALIQAVVRAEGNIVKAVSISFPSVTTLDQALDITCRSAVHAMSDFLQTPQTSLSTASLQEQFVRFWAARWAPVGVANDPHGLNHNWPGNVLKFWQNP